MRTKNSKNIFKVLSFVLLIFVIIFAVLLVKIVNDRNSNDVIDEKMEEVKNPIVVFETNYGNFEIELFLEQSPITAGNFKSLVEKGFYDGTKFHRVMANFMIQGGDPLSKNDSLKNRWGTGGAERIPDEFIRNLSNVRGTIAMANSGPNSGSSQFFINVVNNTYLDWDKAPMTSKHPVFGKVIVGMDIVDKISVVRVSGSGSTPVEPVIIRKAYLKK